MKQPKNIVELITSKHPEIPKELIPRAYDTIGDIVIAKYKHKDTSYEIEIGLDEQKYVTQIGHTFLELLPRIKSVFYKTSETEGDFRVYPMKLAAGENNTLTLHNENNCKFYVDVARAFFNPRQGTERLRIADSIQPSEKNILCLFSGVAPFPINIAKKHKNVKITAIELNPDAHKLAEENINLNKIENQINLICGDAREESEKLPPHSFDLILMPGPKFSENFLDVAFLVAKERARIVFYTFSESGDFDTPKEKIKQIAEKEGCQIEFLTQRRVLPHSPKLDQVCVEFRVLNVK